MSSTAERHAAWIARRAWLAGLSLADPVSLHAPFGIKPAIVVGLGEKWITVEFVTTDGLPCDCRVYRDTGNLPGARIFITPPQEETDAP